MKKIVVLFLLIACSNYIYAIDGDAPEIVSFTFSPETIDVTDVSAVVTLTARVTDATGVETPGLCQIRLDSDITGTKELSRFIRISGTAQDGIYSTDITIPAKRKPGEWRVSCGPFTDLVGNTTELNNFPTSTKKTLTVINSNHIPCSPNGAIIYNTTTGKFNFCEDGGWVEK